MPSWSTVFQQLDSARSALRRARGQAHVSPAQLRELDKVVNDLDVLERTLRSMKTQSRRQSGD